VDAAVRWVKFNVSQKGYYLTNYSESQWRSFAGELTADATALSAVDRAGLLHDAFALSAAGRLPFAAALDLTEYMRDGERELTPWQVKDWLY